jgi:uncharacterized protein
VKAALLAVLLSLAPTARASAPAGAPVMFFEVPVANLAAGKEFYSALLGWEYKDDPAFPGFSEILTAPGGIAGGLTERPEHTGAGARGNVIYAHVERVAEVAARAQTLGAQVLVPAKAVTGVGTIALIMDLDGNALGLWSPEGMNASHRR